MKKEWFNLNKIFLELEFPKETKVYGAGPHPIRIP